MRHRQILAVGGAILILAGTAIAAAPGDPTPVKSQDGEYFDKNGDPTYQIAKDGTVDWYTSAGYLQYGANCLQCHGPDGLGSSYAPSLLDALKTLDFTDFSSIVASGKKDVNTSQDLVMPALGTNPNVRCHLDPIYVYLRARSDAALDRQRPEKVEPKPAAYSQAESNCMGG